MTLPTSLRNIHGTSHTLTIHDANSILRSHNANAVTITIPSDSDVPFELGTIIVVAKVGAGNITLVAASGVILQSADATITAQFTQNGLVKVGFNQWQFG
ncbi:MAG: hypothetical protein EAY76_00025 [Alphaproteobacteria bacterium]|nr:MAG: hypothetical protein EAY76_00025 [Alphaproteobacteria bacterium]TAF36420.1 MAG: hypothetical protein EAZ66_07625 [Alphaproteobacteria bacterium]